MKIKNFADFSLNELFKSDNIYNVILTEHTTWDVFNSYRYSFITKDDVEYRISLSIKNNGDANINFDTKGLSNKDHSSMIFLINTHDTIKVFNTLKSIIDKHEEIKKLIISSSEDRMVFYKKILDYMKIENEYIDDGYTLVGYLKK